MNRLDQSLAGDRCQKQCPGANRCTCTRMPRHEYHICHNEDCICHSKERYEFETEKVRNEKTN